MHRFILLRQEIRVGLMWVAAVLAGLLAFIWAMNRASQVHLKSEAEHTALQWAIYLRDTVPDLDRIFAGGGLTPDAINELGRLRRVGEVFRYKLYSPAGDELLVSDDIVPDAGAAGVFVRTVPTQRVNVEKVHDLVLRGDRLIELKRATGGDRPPIYSEAYVPVMRDGKVLGVVEVYVDQTERAQRITRSFRQVAGAVAVVLLVLFGIAFSQWLVKLRQQRRSEDQVRYLAQHDPLTGVLNRAGFNEALREAEQRAARGSAGFAVLCIDLDRFKEINDSLGHAAGDDALGQASTRLRAAVRQFDIVARVGGDEFAVLQSGVHRADDVSTLAQRIVDALSPTYEIASHRVPGGASVGAAVYGTDGAHAGELLHKADLALYRAKAEGRGRFSFYDAHTDQNLQARRSMIRDLRTALAQDGLTLHFQPLYEGDGTTLSGYEALARWTRPGHGPVSPMEFIPLAEEAGLIGELGEWVLRRACQEAVRWPESVGLSVNLSAAQFRGDLVGCVSRCLQEAGLPGHRLELEITESLLLHNTDAALQTLHALAGMGVRIVMDDFGTGYSSLAYLWRFPFDKLKIDRAFTQNLENDPKVDLIVRSIVSLAHSMNIRVNAEGVETAAQLARLQEHGCDELQGFLLGRPAEAARLDHSKARAQAREATLPRAVTDFGELQTVSAPLA